MHGTQQSSFIRNAATLTIISIIVGGCLMDEEESKADAETLIDHELSGLNDDFLEVSGLINNLCTLRESIAAEIENRTGSDSIPELPGSIPDILTLDLFQNIEPFSSTPRRRRRLSKN